MRLLKKKSKKEQNTRGGASKPTRLQGVHHLTLGDDKDWCAEDGDWEAYCSCGSSCTGFPYAVKEWILEHIRKYPAPR